MNKSVDKFCLFHNACQENDVEQLEALLDDKTFDPTQLNNEAIFVASRCGHLRIVKRLLQHFNIDPSDSNNRAIEFAAENGHAEVVDLLLKDARVNASVDLSWTLFWTLQRGHFQVVKRLLLEERLDLTFNNYAALHCACIKQHWKIAGLILADRRIDSMSEAMPTFENFQIIAEKATQMCIGLQDLELPALVTLEILDALLPTNTVTMYKKWQLIKLIKHFKPN